MLVQLGATTSGEFRYEPSLPLKKDEPVLASLQVSSSLPRFLIASYLVPRTSLASLLLILRQSLGAASSDMIWETNFKDSLANTPVNLSELELIPGPPNRVSMSLPTGEVVQNPEPKSTNGLVNVFKSLTGNKSARNPSLQSPASALAPQLTTANTLKKTIYGGPPNYEQLLELLKDGNPIPKRLAAAESLRHAVQDYPISGVSGAIHSFSA